MSYNVKELRGLTTILDSVVRQLYKVDLEEIQIMYANDKLIIASNEYSHANSICTELKKNLIGSWNFERLMYLAYITSKTIKGISYLQSKFQSALSINKQYGGSPKSWAQAYRTNNMATALEMEKLMKVVMLRKMRCLGHFNDREFSESTYKEKVFSYLGVDLNKALKAHVSFALLAMGVRTSVDLKALKLLDSAPTGAGTINIYKWKNNQTANKVLTQSAERVLMYNCDNYPYKKNINDKIHAEQHLVAMLVDIARETDTAYEANIGGKKQACRVCSPVMSKFKTAYTRAYTVKFNEQEDNVGSVGSGAGGSIDFASDHAEGIDDKPKFVKFIEYWQ